MSQCVFFTKQAPDLVFKVFIGIVKLDSLHLSKLFYQGFVNHKVLFSVSPW